MYYIKYNPLLDIFPFNFDNYINIYTSLLSAQEKAVCLLSTDCNLPLPTTLTSDQLLRRIMDHPSSCYKAKAARSHRCPTPTSPGPGLHSHHLLLYLSFSSNLDGWLWLEQLVLLIDDHILFTSPLAHASCLFFPLPYSAFFPKPHGQQLLLGRFQLST